MIALITPTGARPKQFAFCVEYMRRQTYRGDVIWIIVDDAMPITTNIIPDGIRDRWIVSHTFPEPKWMIGQNTQARNIVAGLKQLEQMIKKINAIFFIEDDDWYSPGYLEKMMARMDGFDLVGETHTVYYNVQLMEWVENHNEEWSSLFQTAMKPKMIPKMLELCNERFIDYALFKTYNGRKNLFRAGNMAIGIKGQPGRMGIGAGHKHIGHAVPDPDGKKLFEFIGNDSNNYFHINK
jgi:hypothetical protein